jgi:hypothetical protein
VLIFEKQKRSIHRKMLKANNSALFQGTNVAVVTIRQAEINYYISVYQSFATQAALLGGFTYGVLQGATSGPNWVFDLDAFYALFATLTIILAVHIILCCLFLQVYGPGLSLYGAAGSMARAADVLRKEQPMIVKSFVLMLACFVCSTVALFWSVLDYIAAITCTGVLALAVWYWYHYSLRIYSQLKWDKRTGNQGNFGNEEDDEDPVARLQRMQNQSNGTDDIEMGSTTSTNPMSINALTSQRLPSSTVIDGYLTRKFVTAANNRWERNYFILDSRGIVTTFKDRKEYRQKINPVSKERPIVLEDFLITFDFISTPDQTPQQKQLFSQATEKPFSFLFVHNDRQNDQKMIFACDTQEELDLWRSALVKFSV